MYEIQYIFPPHSVGTECRSMQMSQVVSKLVFNNGVFILFPTTYRIKSSERLNASHDRSLRYYEISRMEGALNSSMARLFQRGPLQLPEFTCKLIRSDIHTQCDTWRRNISTVARAHWNTCFKHMLCMRAIVSFVLLNFFDYFSLRLI